MDFISSSITYNNRQDLIPITFSDTFGETTVSFDCVTPESVSETPFANTFNTINFLGRTPGSMFNGVNPRQVNFRIKLIADSILANSLQEQVDKYLELINILKSLAIPTYSSNGTIPTMVYCQVGNFLTITGEYTMGTINYSGPIRNGVFCIAEFDISIKAVLDKSISANEVLDGREYEPINL